MRIWLAVMAAVLACCAGPQSRPEFPAVVIGYQRGDAAASAMDLKRVLTEIGASEPEVLRYSGNGMELEVGVGRMQSEASAFEARQRWRPREGMVGLNSGSYFVVVRGAVPAQGLIRFGQEFEKAWGVK